MSLTTTEEYAVRTLENWSALTLEQRLDGVSLKISRQPYWLVSFWGVCVVLELFFAQALLTSRGPLDGTGIVAGILGAIMFPLVLVLPMFYSRIKNQTATSLRLTDGLLIFRENEAYDDTSIPLESITTVQFQRNQLCVQTIDEPFWLRLTVPQRYQFHLLALLRIHVQRRKETLSAAGHDVRARPTPPEEILDLRQR